MLAIFTRAGVDGATVVIVGALFGPAQVLARLGEYAVAGDTHPLIIVRFAIGLIAFAFALLATFGISPPIAFAFSILFGIGNGLATLARGTVPLAPFGAAGYGRLVGIVGRPFMLMQAAAPLSLAVVAERISDAAALGVIAVFALASLACFAILRPRPAEV